MLIRRAITSIEPDQFRGTVGSFDSKEDFSGVFVTMDADVKCALSGDSDFLGRMVASVGGRDAGS
jgi:hypothetical protein